MPKQLIRWSVALVVALGLFVGLTSPAGAAELPVSGSYAGDAILTQQGCTDPPAAGIGHTVDATGTLTSFGDVEVDGLVCLANPSPTMLGSFTITGAEGSITADMTGTLTSLEPLGNYREDMTLTVTGGTGELEGATGTLTIVGTFTLAGQQGTGDVSGSITVPPRTPTSKDDCKNGGWQDFEDENGEPFENQGECIAWVNHNT